MELSTKFNINDEVWFLHPTSQKAVQGRIKEIQVKVGGKPKYRSTTDGTRGLMGTGEYEARRFVNLYYIDDMVRKESVFKREDEIYETKEQLVGSLKAKINNL